MPVLEAIPLFLRFECLVCDVCLRDLVGNQAGCRARIISPNSPFFGIDGFVLEAPVTTRR